MPDENKPAEPEARGGALKNVGHWQHPLTGHGLAYFRELVVEYQTLPWVNPHAGTAAVARHEADEKAASLKRANEALKPAVPPVPPAPAPAVNPDLKKLLEEARVAASKAEEAALQAAAQQAAAEKVHAAAVTIIQALIEKSATGTATWSDLLEFESALLRLFRGEKLRSYYDSLAAEYAGLTGVAAMEAPKDEEALQARAAMLLANLHWAYTTGPVQEAQRTRMVLSLSGVAVVVFLILLCLAGWSRCSVLAWIALAGAAGATLSAFQRVQSRALKGDALVNCEKESTGRKWSDGRCAYWHALWTRTCAHGSFALAPVIGAVSAIVLVHLLSAGIISSPILPNLAGASTNTPPKTNLLADGKETVKPAQPSTVSSTNATDTNEPRLFPPALTDPKETKTADQPPRRRDNVALICRCWPFTTCKNLALLLVWGFVAGFSERLVPDMLSRLAKKAEGKV